MFVECSDYSIVYIDTTFTKYHCHLVIEYQ